MTDLQRLAAVLSSLKRRDMEAFAEAICDLAYDKPIDPIAVQGTVIDLAEWAERTLSEVEDAS